MEPGRLRRILRPGRWLVLALLALITTLAVEVRRARHGLDTACLDTASEAQLDVLVEGAGSQAPQNLSLRWSTTGQGRAEYKEERKTMVMPLEHQRARSLALRIAEALNALPAPAPRQASVIVTLVCDGRLSTAILRAPSPGGTWRTSLFDCARGGALTDSLQQRFACAGGWMAAKVSGPRDADERAGAIAQRVDVTLEALRLEQVSQRSAGAQPP